MLCGRLPIKAMIYSTRGARRQRDLSVLSRYDTSVAPNNARCHTACICEIVDLVIHDLKVPAAGVEIEADRRCRIAANRPQRAVFNTEILHVGPEGAIGRRVARKDTITHLEAIEDDIDLTKSLLELR